MGKGQKGEKRQLGWKRTAAVEPYPATPETTETDASIEKKMREAKEAARYERAVRVGRCFQAEFPDVPDYNNTECARYMARVKDAVEGAPAVPAEPDALAAAVRELFPDAPGPDAGEEECRAFAAALAEKPDGAGGDDVPDGGPVDDATIARVVKAVLPDVPADVIDCRGYLKGLADSGRDAERMERFLAPLAEMLPADADDATMARVESAWLTYLVGEQNAIRQLVIGALRPVEDEAGGEDR